MIRRSGLVLSGVLIAGLAPAIATPNIPGNDNFVLETVPGAADPMSRQLRDLDRRLATDRSNLALATQVGRLDIIQSRRLGDPRFLGHAEAALAPWPPGPATPTSVLLLRAVIAQSVHDFDGSVALLHRVLDANADQLQAWLTLASVEQVQARYPAALRDCGQLATHVIGLAPDICVASVMALTGHAEIALKAVTITLAENHAEAAAQPETAGWALTLAAEIAERLGDPSTEQRYRAALAHDPDDPYLLGAYADWLLDRHRPAEVVALLRQPERTRIDPLLLRLALAEQDLNSPDLTAHVTDLAARFETSRRRGDVIHRREEARFVLHLLHQPDRALAIAKANWATQREPADARILLEAAIAAHDPIAAAPVRAWQADNHVEDRRLAGGTPTQRQEQP
jgi:hypothetical protein